MNKNQTIDEMILDIFEFCHDLSESEKRFIKTYMEKSYITGKIDALK